MKHLVILFIASTNVFAFNQSSSQSEWIPSHQPSTQLSHQHQQRAFNGPNIKHDGVPSTSLREKLIHKPEQLEKQQYVIGASLSLKKPRHFRRNVIPTKLVIGDTTQSATNNQPTFEQAPSGVFYQVQPHPLQNTPVYHQPQFNQTHSQENLNVSPNQQQASESGLALQIQPQYLVQQPQQNQLHHQQQLPRLNLQPQQQLPRLNQLPQQQLPVYYNQPLPTPTLLNFPPATVVGAKANQYLRAPVLNTYQQNPQVTLPQYTQQFATGTNVLPPQKLVSLNPATPSFIENGKVASGNGLRNFNGIAAQPAAKQQTGGGSFFGAQTPQNPSSLGDTSAGPDFSKIFQGYFSAGPFADTFRDDSAKPAATVVQPNVNNGFHNFFGELNAVPTTVPKQVPAEDQFKPCNFFHQSNTNVESDDEDDADEDSSNKKTTRVKNNPDTRDYFQPPEGYGGKGGRSHAEEAYNAFHQNKAPRYRNSHRDDENSSEESSESQRHPQSEEEGSSEEDDSDDDDDDRSSNRRPSRPNHRHGGNHRYNNDDRYAGKSSNHRQVKPNHSNRYESGNRQRDHRNDEDDDEEEDEKRFKSEPNSEIFEGNYRQAKKPYKYSQKGQSPTKVHQQASNPGVRTFHRYPTPKFEAENTRKPQAFVEHRQVEGRERRPPPPVREPDTVGYYSYNPEVKTGLYYQKMVVMTDNTNQGQILPVQIN